MGPSRTSLGACRAREARRGPGPRVAARPGRPRPSHAAAGGRDPTGTRRFAPARRCRPAGRPGGLTQSRSDDTYRPWRRTHALSTSSATRRAARSSTGFARALPGRPARGGPASQSPGRLAAPDRPQDGRPGQRAPRGHASDLPARGRRDRGAAALGRGPRARRPPRPTQPAPVPQAPGAEVPPPGWRRGGRASGPPREGGQAGAAGRRGQEEAREEAGRQEVGTRQGAPRGGAYRG